MSANKNSKQSSMDVHALRDQVGYLASHIASCTAYDAYNIAVKRSESQIEAILCATFVLYCWRINSSKECFRSVLFNGDIESADTLASFAATNMGHIVVSPQIKVDRYRVDFMAALDNCSETRLLVIECDGHEWHERTKEQAAHDKARDRYLTNNGMSVMRFTGSEIVANPLSCVGEIVQYFTGSNPFIERSNTAASSVMINAVARLANIEV
jgi:very-short-patch-repair endonuclease